MALSGDFYQSNTIAGGHYNIHAHWSATQDVANNQSTITMSIYFETDYKITVSSHSGGYSYIAGSRADWSTPSINDTASGSWDTYGVYTHVYTVGHNADGTKSLDLSFSYPLNATLSGTYYGTQTGSSTITLDTINRNTAPSTPTIQYPVANSTVYTQRPRICCKVNGDANGDAQIVDISFDNFASYANTVSPNSYWSNNDYIPINTQIIFKPTWNLGIGSITASCRTYDGKVNSGSTSVTFKIANPPWVETIGVGTNTIKLSHITELRTVIDNVRVAYGLTAKTWTQLQVGDVARLAHFKEMYDAISEIRNQVNSWNSTSWSDVFNDSTFNSTTINAQVNQTLIATYINDLRTQITNV